MEATVNCTHQEYRSIDALVPLRIILGCLEIPPSPFTFLVSTWLDCPRLQPQGPGFNLQGSRFSSRIYTRSFFFFIFIFQLLIEEEEAEKKIRRKKKQREREILSHSSYEIGTRERASGCIQAFRRKRELTGERGNEVSFKMVRARALRGRL